MTEQDEKIFYTGMIILGLLVRGTPINSVAPIAKDLVESVLCESHEEV